MSQNRRKLIRIFAGLTAVMMLPFMFSVAEENAQPVENPETVIENAEPDPTPVPTEVPTPVPTEVPTPVPTEVPTPVPTEVPTPVPTEVPTEVPTPVPTEVPTPVPTEVPTPVPTEVPTPVPTEVPTEVPTPVPTEVPTEEPAVEPTVPSQAPTEVPTSIPEPIPTQVPAATDAPVQDTTPVPTEIPAETPVPETTAIPESTSEPAATDEPASTEAPAGDFQAWVQLTDGTIYTGSIEAVIAHAPKNKPIYIATFATLYVREFDLTLLQEDSANIYFLPDPDTFRGKKWQVILSLTEDLQTPLTQNRVNAAQEDDDPVQLWLRVVRIEDPTATPVPEITPVPEETIPVIAEETPVPTAGSETDESAATPAPAAIEETAAPTADVTPEQTEVPTQEPAAEDDPVTTEVPPVQVTEAPAPAVTAAPAPQVTPVPVTVPVSDPTRVPLPEETAAPAVTEAPILEQVQNKPAIPDPTRIPLPTEQPMDGILVTAHDVNAGTWTNIIPSFQLSGITDSTYYAYLYDDEVVTRMESDTYSPDKQGIYILRFALMDKETDALVDVSPRWSLMLDFTAPELYIFNSDTKAYTIELIASDVNSGLDAYSTDGGKTWKQFKEGAYRTTVTYKETTKLSAGTFQVRDVAGNITVFDKRITAGPLPSTPYHGGRSFKHIRETGEIEGIYDAYELEVPQEEVTTLTLGDETADLSALTVGSEDAIPIAEKLITLQLPDGSEAVALLLCPRTAVDNHWVFNGAVLTKLKSSGIDWLALECSGNVLVCPTADLLTGVTYDMLKAQGVGSRSFTYDIARDHDSFTVLVTVNGMTYTATPGATPGFSTNGTWEIESAVLAQSAGYDPANIT